MVPKSVERSTYVLLASLVLRAALLAMAADPDAVWTVESPLAVAVLWTIFWLGWAVLLISTFLINHFELFGLAQVVGRLRGKKAAAPVFRTPLFYKHVRHPLYLGFLLAFWAAPSMSVGHLLFSVATTGYILLGIFLEERDLVALFGDQYRSYRQQVGMLVPWPRRIPVGRSAGPEIDRPEISR